MGRFEAFVARHQEKATAAALILGSVIVSFWLTGCGTRVVSVYSPDDVSLTPAKDEPSGKGPTAAELRAAEMDRAEARRVEDRKAAEREELAKAMAGTWLGTGKYKGKPFKLSVKFDDHQTATVNYKSWGCTGKWTLQSKADGSRRWHYQETIAPTKKRGGKCSAAADMVQVDAEQPALLRFSASEGTFQGDLRKDELATRVRVRGIR